MLQFLVAILKADTDGTAAYQLLVLKELITTMTVRHGVLFSFLVLGVSFGGCLCLSVHVLLLRSVLLAGLGQAALRPPASDQLALLRARCVLGREVLCAFVLSQLLKEACISWSNLGSTFSLCRTNPAVTVKFGEPTAKSKHLYKMLVPQMSIGSMQEA